MYRQGLSLVAGLLAAAALSLSPGTATAAPRGGGGHAGHVGGGGGWHGGGGGGWHGGGGNWYGGGYRHGGWGGWGVGIGIGYPGYGYGGYGSGYYGGYGYSPYYYNGDVVYDTYPSYAGPSNYYYNAPVYGGMTPDYGYGAASAVPSNVARVRVIVPEGAKVWFDGAETQQSGTVRMFESPALTPGREYTYSIKAQWRDADGKEVTRTKPVDVRANGQAGVDFTK
jgi:uncharacterized protein (TIGR03000 family)